jgi:hypothetical protein
MKYVHAIEWQSGKGAEGAALADVGNVLRHEYERTASEVLGPARMTTCRRRKRSAAARPLYTREPGHSD